MKAFEKRLSKLEQLVQQKQAKPTRTWTKNTDGLYTTSSVDVEARAYSQDEVRALGGLVLLADGGIEFYGGGG